MRIVVNDIAASKGGAMTVLKDFYQYVKENDTVNEWIFLLGDNYLEPTDNISIVTFPEIKKSWAKRLLFDSFTGKKFISTLHPDVVLSLQNTAVRGVKVPQVVYMHQSIPFQTVKNFSFFKSSERKLAVYQHIVGRVIKDSLRKADKVIVQTEWIKKAVANQCGIEESRIVKAFPIVRDLTDYVDEGVFDKTTFFYPTSAGIYKNNSVVFDASKRLDGDNVKHSVVLTLNESDSKGSVKCVGRLPYEEVLDFYNKSTLIFASYIETFGYPMAEASKMGAIVIASDCPFSREVLEGYDNAYFFSPNDSDALADLMKKVVSGEISKKAIPCENVTEQNDGWKTVIETVLSVK